MIVGIRPGETAKSSQVASSFVVLFFVVIILVFVGLVISDTKKAAATDKESQVIYSLCVTDHPAFDCRVFMATGKFPQ